MSVSHLFNSPQLETTVLRKKGATASGPQTGEKKVVSGSGAHLAKVEREAEEGNLALPKIPLSFRIEMQKARTKEKLTQADLASKLNMPVDLIKKYEAGTIVPEGQHLGKIKRALKISN